MIPVSVELPDAVRTQRTLARWIWTLYAQRPGLSEVNLVELTGADQGYVNRSVKALLSVGLLVGDGPHRRVAHDLAPVSMVPLKHRGSAEPDQAAVRRSGQRVYQVRTRAAAQCRALNGSDGSFWKVFRVKSGLTGETVSGNRAAGTLYVVARTALEVPGLVATQSKNVHLYVFGAEDGPRRALVQQIELN